MDVRSTELNRMGALFRQFETLREAQRGQRLSHMRGFLAEFEAVSEKLRQQRGATFNTFALLNVESDEVRHSQMLAWLLDARADHNEGNLFVRALVKGCRLDIPAGALDRYQVRTEYAGMESIIDIMIYRPRVFLIYLENKVFAAEGLDQIDREYRDLNRIGRALQIPKAQRYAIFLTPTGRRPTSGDPTPWRSLAYSQLAATLKRVLPVIKSAKVEFIVADWIDTVLSFGGVYDDQPIQ